MSRMTTTVAMAVAFLGWELSAHAQEPAQPAVEQQLRSFQAIQRIVLDPPLPGTEKAHKELTTNLWFALPRDPSSDLSPQRVVREPQFPGELASYVWVSVPRDSGLDLSPEARPAWARCTPHVDLPKPERVGLACHDLAGRYIGTLRARRIQQVVDRLHENYFGLGKEGTAIDALPLNQYRFINVESVEDDSGWGWMDEYVAELLRADGYWQVVKSPDLVPVRRVSRTLRSATPLLSLSDSPSMRSATRLAATLRLGRSSRYRISSRPSPRHRAQSRRCGPMTQASAVTAAFPADDFTFALRAAVWSAGDVVPDAAAAACSSHRGALGGAAYTSRADWLGVSYVIEGAFTRLGPGQVAQLEVWSTDQKRTFARALLAVWLKKTTE